MLKIVIFGFRILFLELGRFYRVRGLNLIDFIYLIWNGYFVGYIFLESKKEVFIFKRDF